MPLSSLRKLRSNGSFVLANSAISTALWPLLYGTMHRAITRSSGNCAARRSRVLHTLPALNKPINSSLPGVCTTRQGVESIAIEPRKTVTRSRKFQVRFPCHNG
jgi:hypothetical protein